MSLSDGRILPAFIRNALNGWPLEIHGSGDHSRCFCFVADFIDALAAVPGMIVPGDHAEVPVLNIGSQDERTVREIAKLVLTLSGSESRVANVNAAEDDPPRRVPEIERARQWLGWTPQTPLERGVSLMIDDFRRRLALAA